MSLVRTTTDVVQANASASIVNAQAFSVNLNGVGFNTLNNVNTKAPFATIEYDENSAWDAVNFRFKPLPGRKYILTASATCAAPAAGMLIVCSLWRNGGVLKNGSVSHAAAAGAVSSVGAWEIVSALNDFYELFVLQNSGGALVISGVVNETWFQGVQVG